MKIKKIKAKMNKPVYLGLSILETSKTVICEFWYNFIKPKFKCNPKLGYMDADSFIIHIKTEVVYEDIAYDIKKSFDISYYEFTRPSLIETNRKMIVLMKGK